MRLISIFLPCCTLLFKFCEGFEFFDREIGSISFAIKNSMQRSSAIFATQPFDYKVDWPTTLNYFSPDSDLPTTFQHIAHETVTFNIFFSHFPENFLALLEERYSEMFLFLYPGLKDVPVHVSDVEGLIVFGLLYLLSDDACFFPTKFFLLSKELQKKFDKSLFASYLAKFSCDTFSEISAEDVFEDLFKFAIGHNLVYTVEAFFASKLQSFSRENLNLAINSSSVTGDSRLVSRIALEIDPDTRFEVFSTAASSRSWPKYKDYRVIRQPQNSAAPILKITFQNIADSLFEIKCLLGTVGRE